MNNIYPSTPTPQKKQNNNHNCNCQYNYDSDYEYSSQPKFDPLEITINKINITEDVILLPAPNKRNHIWFIYHKFIIPNAIIKKIKNNKLFQTLLTTHTFFICSLKKLLMLSQSSLFSNL